MVQTTDQVVLAVAETDWAFIGMQHRVPRRVPPEVAQAFLVVPADQEP